VSLAPLEATSAATQAVSVQTPSGLAYWLDYRQPLGVDAYLADWPGVTGGVEIHVPEPYTTGGNGTDLLDGTPDGSFYDEVLPYGASWSTPEGIGIAVGQPTADGVPVTVDYLPGDPNLTVTSTDDPDPVTTGSPITYEVTVANDGSAPARSVTLADVVTAAGSPSGVVYRSISPSQGSCSGGGPFTCSLGTLDPGAAATIAVVVTPIAPTTVTNSARVTTEDAETSLGDNSASEDTTAIAAPGTAYVDVLETGFSVPSVRLPLGGTAQWNFYGPGTYSVADDTGMELFSTGPKRPVTAFGYHFSAAGVYYVSDGAGHTMRVSERMKSRPATGEVGTTFTVVESAVTAPIGFLHDIQIRRPTSSAFVGWKTGVKGASAAFIPTIAGTYSFRGRYRRIDGGASGWSAPISITVS
jgi:uncharacterized repeat protein (TIGR01451 family)